MAAVPQLNHRGRGAPQGKQAVRGRGNREARHRRIAVTIHPAGTHPTGRLPRSGRNGEDQPPAAAAGSRRAAGCSLPPVMTGTPASS